MCGVFPKLSAGRVVTDLTASTALGQRPQRATTQPHFTLLPCLKFHSLKAFLQYESS